MSPEYFRMTNNKLLNNVPYLVPEQAPLLILDIKSDICMDNNGEETKHTSHFSRRTEFVRNGEEWNFHKTVWCEGGLKMSYIGTNNIKEYELNHRLGCSMVILKN